jgi:hypothetical protein
MPSRTMVAQLFFEALTSAAAVKVQPVPFWRAAFLRFGAGVGSGFAETRSEATPRASPSAWTK